MKISQIDIFPVTIPLKGSFRNAHAVRTSQNSIVLRVLGDEGVDGVGNVDPDPGYSIERFSTLLFDFIHLCKLGPYLLPPSSRFELSQIPKNQNVPFSP